MYEIIIFKASSESINDHLTLHWWRQRQRSSTYSKPLVLFPNVPKMSEEQMLLKATVSWWSKLKAFENVTQHSRVSPGKTQSKPDYDFDFPPDSADEEIIRKGKWVFLKVNIPPVILLPTALRFASCNEEHSNSASEDLSDFRSHLWSFLHQKWVLQSTETNAQKGREEKGKQDKSFLPLSVVISNSNKRIQQHHEKTKVGGLPILFSPLIPNDSSYGLVTWSDLFCQVLFSLTMTSTSGSGRIPYVK